MLWSAGSWPFVIFSIAAIGARPIPPHPVAPIFAIVYDLQVPRDAVGGISSLLPHGHVDGNHGTRWYYRQIAAALRQLGYQQGQYSFYAQQTTMAAALADAAQLQTMPNLAWMAVPGVVQRLHVVELCHAGSLY